MTNKIPNRNLDYKQIPKDRIKKNYRLNKDLW
jgi:hypothetical protein